MSVIAFLPWPTTRAPAVKNWHSCSERHHMLLLWAEQDLTLALLTLLLSQRGDGRDKSLTSECEFTQRHVPALILPILLPLKEVKICLGRWLSVLSFREESVTWTRVCHIDLEVCYEIINALSLWRLLTVTNSAHSQYYLVSSLNARTKLLWILSWAEMVWNRNIPKCPGHSGTINSTNMCKENLGREKLLMSAAVNWAVHYKRQLLGQERFLCWDICPDMKCGSWAGSRQRAGLQLLGARACQPWASRRAREGPSAVSINSSLPRQVNVITEPAQMVIHSVIWNYWEEWAV